MSEIGLQDLIYQVKHELLAPNAIERNRDPYPLFVIDKIDLEISVSISQKKGGGIKLEVLNFAQVEHSTTDETTRGHVIKVSLSSLLSREELLLRAFQDEKVQEAITSRSSQGFLKQNSELIGSRE